jgi:hypothetical protein
MGRSRLDLHAELVEVTPNVYFQPPSNSTMQILQYPCIVYQRDFSQVDFADDIPYKGSKRYQLTVIDRNPDSDIPDVIEAMRYCAFSRFLVADDLNHFIFRLYF